MTIRGLSRRLVTLTGGAAIIAGGLTFAGTHGVLAATNCNVYQTNSTTWQTVGGVHVYSGKGVTGQAAVAAGVCLDDTPLPVAVPDYSGSTVGGDFEAGANPTGNGRIAGSPTVGPLAAPGVYAVVDGSDNNGTVGDPTGRTNGLGLIGYAGVSDFESGGYNPVANDPPGANSCGNDGQTPSGGGSNAGGAVNAKALCGTTPNLPLPIACGFTSGPDWYATARDGCFFP